MMKKAGLAYYDITRGKMSEKQECQEETEKYNSLWASLFYLKDCL